MVSYFTPTYTLCIKETKVQSYRQKQKNKYRNTETLVHLRQRGRKSSTIIINFAQTTQTILRQSFLTNFLEEVCYLMLYKLGVF